MKKTNFKALLLLIAVMFSTSCAVKHEAILGDAIRFSDDATTSYTHKDGKFKNLSEQSGPNQLYGRAGVNYGEVNKLKEFIHRNHSAKNTAGYYALDLGLDRVSYVRRHQFKHDPNTKYYIIYMTDGLDNASVQLAKNKKQLWFISSEQAYAKRIQRKIKKTMGALKLNQNTFKIFPIMFLGSDLQTNYKKRGLKTMAEIEKAAKEDMQYYRGSSKGTSAPEVILGTDFKKITKDFQEMFASTGFEFYVPTGYRNQQIRMTLENDNKETIQIEGTLKKKWFMWCLTDIKYASNVTIPDQRVLHRGQPLKELYASNRKDKTALSAFFRLDDIKLNGKNFKVKYASQEHGKYYETNTEYEAAKSANADAYILLIMDESASLGNQTKNEQKAMEDILDIVIKTATN